MATVIDELIVLLKLDGSQLSEEQKKVASEFVRLKEGAGRANKEAKEGTDGLTKAFTALQGRLLGIAALFLGGMGIKQFTEQVAQLTNQLGRAGQQAGVTAAELSAYGNVGRELGANPQGVRAAVSGIAAAGNTPTVNPAFQTAVAAMGISPNKLANGDLDINKLMTDMAKFVDRERAQGRGDASITEKLKLMPGMNADMVTALLQGSEKFGAAMRKMKELGPTPEQVESIAKLTKAWADMTATAEKLGLVLLQAVEPVLENILKIAEKFFGVVGGDLSGKKITPAPGGDFVAPGGEFIPGLDQMKTNPAKPGEGSSAARRILGALNPIGTARADTPPPSQAITGTYSTKKQEVAADIAAQFRGAGVPDSGAAAILANVQRESGFNPTLRHPDQPKFSGEAHYAHGLYQEGGDEWNNYAAWLQKNYPGRSWQDPRLQTQFLIENLKKNYPKVWAGLQNPNLSAGQKAMLFQRGYLRPAATHGGDAAVAEQYLRSMPKTTPDVWNNSTTNSSSSSQTNLNGGIHIYTDKSNAYDIAGGIHGALIDRANSAGQSDTGPW